MDIKEEITQFKYGKELRNIRFKELKKQAHNELVQKHKKVLKAMDILVVVIILMNFGAVLLTNFMVVKEKEVLIKQGVIESYEIVESNPVQAKINNYKTNDKSKVKFKSFIIFIIMWSILTYGYFYARTTFYTETGFYTLVFILIFYFLSMGMDLFNNLGYWLGKRVFALRMA